MKLHWRIWVLIIILGLSLLSIFASLSPLTIPAFEKGALIKSVEKNSSEFEAGIRAGMILKEINLNVINSAEDYATALANSINYSNQKYSLVTDKGAFVFIANKPLTIAVSSIPKTKLKTGLDLSGGARALIRPANVSLSDEEINDLIAVTSERFNVYGLKDITIKSVKDLQGNNYMLIEIAGSTPSELEDLVSNQGKFEGKIGNITLFSGGKGDISHVERSGQQAGIEGCSDTAEGSVCRFSFPITLTEESAQRHADVTSKLGFDSQNPEYLSEKLNLYIDDNLMDSLYISKNLKGRVTTQISIQGSGAGANQQEAFNEANANMKKLQTVLITGSLPYKLEIVKLDTISPTLGKAFTKNLFILAITVFIVISVILFIKYRKIKITSAVILTMFSEAVITLGIAALISWNLDAPSIAGIIAGMGTGVNDQIVIIDESISNSQISLKERIKRAFFIIIGAFFTIVAAMIPLFWAGAGMLKGFALTTILSVMVGILITRPAFSEILKKIQE